MNKQELIARNSGVKLYDLSDPSDIHRMNMNLAYCSKKSKEPTFKLIAPFGHELKYDADFYYFESENTPISEQILEEMGFGSEGIEEWNILVCKILIEVFFTEKPSVFINEREKNLNANQLYQLITLLS